MLNIWHNRIDEEGAKYLANALNNNEVRYDLLVSIIDVCHDHSFQTLTTLNFSIYRVNREILDLFRGDLRIDTVREDLFVSLFCLMRRSLSGRSSVCAVRFKSIIWRWLRRRSNLQAWRGWRWRWRCGRRVNRIIVSICQRVPYFGQLIY